MKVKVFRYITSISASLSLLATHFSFIQPAEAQFGNIFGRCGLPGEATVKVHYLIHPRRGSKLYIEVEKEGTLGGVVGRELGPGTGASEFTTGICNRDGFRVKIYTPQECGKTLLAESRFSRVYNAEDVWIKEDGITISNGDALSALTEASKLTLALVAAFKTGGTLSPAAIKAAQKFKPCLTKSPGCPMGPNEFQRMRADRCFSQALALASQNQRSRDNSYYHVYIQNKTNRLIWVAVNFLQSPPGSSGSDSDVATVSPARWITKGYWKLNPGQKTLILDDEERISNKIIYFHAHDEQGKVWGSSEKVFDLRGENQPFFEANMGDEIGTYTQSFTTAD